MVLFLCAASPIVCPAFAAAFAAAALAAFGPPTVDPHPPLPLLQCLTFQNDNNNFLQPIETKFAGIPPNVHGKTLLLLPPLSHHPSGPTPLAFIVLGVLPPPLPPPTFGPPCSCCCVKNPPLPLLTFQNVRTAVVAFFVLFLPFVVAA